MKIKRRVAVWSHELPSQPSKWFEKLVIVLYDWDYLTPFDQFTIKSIITEELTSDPEVITAVKNCLKWMRKNKIDMIVD